MPRRTHLRFVREGYGEIATNYTEQELAAIMDYFRRTIEVLYKRWWN